MVQVQGLMVQVQGGWDPFWSLTETKTDCEYKYYGEASGNSSAILITTNGTVTSSVYVKISETYSFKGKIWECYDGMNPFCTRVCRAVI